METFKFSDVVQKPSDLDPPSASLLKRGLLYAWRKICGVRLSPKLEPKVKALFRLVKPMRAVGFSKIRVGSSRDGGYVMLDDFAEVAGVYSIGIGSDVSWDLELARLGLPIFQYDHTVLRPPTEHQLFHFEKLGLCATPSTDAQLDTLENMLKRHHQEPGKLILKIDVEGAEWAVFDHLNKEVLPRFRQIACEFHNLHRLGEGLWFDRAHRVFSLLNKTHQAVHIHRNNWGPRIWIDGLEIPMIFEVTFASRAIYQFETQEEPFPGPHDLPSTPLFPDRPLDFLQQL